jgi:hypothetical protein
MCPGVDVMIRIFLRFCRFSAQKLAVFSKTNVVIDFFEKLHSCSLIKKRQYFREIFWQKIFSKSYITSSLERVY